MARVIPLLRDDTLTYQHEDMTRTLIIDTPAWQNWLTHATSFVVEHEHCTFTVRKERAGNQRGDWYWRAYYTSNSTLHRVYIGKAKDLTSARLQEIAWLLVQQQGHRAFRVSNDENAPVHSGITTKTSQGGYATGSGKKHPYYWKQQRVLMMTRLAVPPVRAQFIVRPRLLEQLLQVTNYKLTLVSAPAGFGKTTLLSTWATTLRQDEPVAWFSLHEDDNDPELFWSYFIAALQTIEPNIGTESLALLHSGQPDLEMILTMLTNTLARLSRHIILVLDDYHLIETPSIHRSMTFLLDQLPAQVHLVLLSRIDPPFPLSRLRARNELLELRTPQLRFTFDETTAFFQQTMNLALQSEDITALETRTEGWIAGLQLAALSLKGLDDTSHFLADFTASSLPHHHIIDYLAEEVLNQQPAPIHSFLLHTCILDRLNSALCNALLGQSNSHEMLRELEQKNLFLVPLDNQRQWFRYHHLFSDVLRNFLQQSHPECIPELHQKASQWYEQNGLLFEAIHHALAATDFARAATLIEQLAAGIIWQYSERVTLLRWIDALPENVIRTRPQLCILHAWASLLASYRNPSFDIVETRLQVTQQFLEANEDDKGRKSQMMLGEIAAIQSLVCFLKNDISQVSKLAYQALELLARENTTLRCLAARVLVYVYYFSGDLAAADRGREELVNVSRTTDDFFSTYNALYTIASLQKAQGQLHQATSTYQQMIQLVGQKWIPAMSYMGLSGILLEWNEIDRAEEYLMQTKHYIEQSSELSLAVDGYKLFASLYIAQGDFQRTFAALDAAERIISTSQHSFLDPNMIAAQRAWLHLLQGNLAEAHRWAQTCKLDKLKDNQYLTPSRLVELTTLARIYLVDNKAKAALDLLERAIQIIERSQPIQHLIQLCTLQALAFSSLDDSIRARSSLERALSLGESGGYIRTFVNEGPQLVTLLKDLLATRQKGEHSIYHVSPDYICRLLTAFGHQPDACQEALLSQRERDVVRLMAQGLSDREIAQRLVLAESTIKTYARRIYIKLDVKNRTQAVIRARELHL